MICLLKSLISLMSADAIGRPPNRARGEASADAEQSAGRSAIESITWSGCRPERSSWRASNFPVRTSTPPSEQACAPRTSASRSSPTIHARSRRHVERIERRTEEGTRRLAEHRGLDVGRLLDGGEERAGVELQAPFGAPREVAVHGDQRRAGDDAIEELADRLVGELGPGSTEDDHVDGVVRGISPAPARRGRSACSSPGMSPLESNRQRAPGCSRATYVAVAIGAVSTSSGSMAMPASDTAEAIDSRDRDVVLVISRKGTSPERSAAMASAAPCDRLPRHDEHAVDVEQHGVGTFGSAHGGTLTSASDSAPERAGGECRRSTSATTSRTSIVGLRHRCEGPLADEHGRPARRGRWRARLGHRPEAGVAVGDQRTVMATIAIGPASTMTRRPGRAAARRDRRTPPTSVTRPAHHTSHWNPALRVSSASRATRSDGVPHPPRPQLARREHQRQPTAAAAGVRRCASDAQLRVPRRFAQLRAAVGTRCTRTPTTRRTTRRRWHRSWRRPATSPVTRSRWWPRPPSAGCARPRA